MRLSVVVTIVDGGEALAHCLRALSDQVDPPELEVLIPWDDSVAGMNELSNRFPAFRFLPLGALTTERPLSSAAGQHELFDRRRAAGLNAATGDVIAIVEDRGLPRANWARTMTRLHEQLPHAVVGGAIENGRDSTMNWAVYFCDFGRYQQPFEAGARQWVSDVNIGYKRRGLDATRELWRDRYHETTVHWALQRAGETLYLTPELVVDQMRGRLRLGALIGERFAWGRLFAYTRAREVSVTKRLALAVLAPLLPALLLLRHTRLQIAKGVRLREFVLASPVILVLLVAWSLGETVGYLTANP
jgi:hypothetical protein